MLGTETGNHFKADPTRSRRFVKEDGHSYRNEFQRDRDRILYSKAFRRLGGKTQVFVSGFDDNIRTRLTHTLEVAQIATTICHCIGLNAMLAEAIALGHDVGHTPFGHAGERELNCIMNNCEHEKYHCKIDFKKRGFKHNLQGMKILAEVETGYDANNSGLNLTREVLWGIVHHSSLKWKQCEWFNVKDGHCLCRNKRINCINSGSLGVDFYSDYLKKFCDAEDWTVEAYVVSIADEIAQRHHDVEDGLYENAVSKNLLTEKLKELFEKKHDEIDKELAYNCKEEGNNPDSIFVKKVSRFIVDTYCTEYIDSMRKQLSVIQKEYGIKDSEDFYKRKREIYEYLDGLGHSLGDVFGFFGILKQHDEKFKQFLNDMVLQSELTQTMDGKSCYVIRRLFLAYYNNPQQLPDKTIMELCNKLDVNFLSNNKDNGKEILPRLARQNVKKLMRENIGDEDKCSILMRVICDYISGMTDQYAMQQFRKLYGTSSLHNEIL